MADRNASFSHPQRDETSKTSSSQNFLTGTKLTGMTRTNRILIHTSDDQPLAKTHPGGASFRLTVTWFAIVLFGTIRRAPSAARINV
jgi:hypothetical protein